jgi:hypothetical protein
LGWAGIPDLLQDGGLYCGLWRDCWGYVAVNDATIVKRYWRHTGFATVPIGSPFTVEVELPSLVDADMTSGKQALFVAIEMKYNDGFPDSPEQRWVFCDASSYSQVLKGPMMRPCEDPDSLLHQLIGFDGYPDPKYEYQNPNEDTTRRTLLQN